MKYHLNESSQKRQKAILDALKTGVPLAGLLAVTALSGGGCGNTETTMGEAPAVSAAPAQQPNRANENPEPFVLGRTLIPKQPNRPNENHFPSALPGEPVVPEKHDK